MITKSRHSDVIESLVRKVTRPMKGLTPRGARAFEAIARKAFKESARFHMIWFDACLKAARDPYEKALDEKWPMGTPQAKFTFDESYELKALHESTCGSGCNHITHDIEKRVPDDLFQRNFGKALDKIFASNSQEFLDSVMDSKSPDSESNAVFQEMFFNAIHHAYKDAQTYAKERYKKEPPAWQEENPLVDRNPHSIFEKDDKFIKKLYMEGYTHLKDAISIKFQDGIKEIMNNALLKGVPWNATAELLNDRFGERGLWHWQRLVRTEMAGAIDKAHYEQYKDMDIQYVRISTALNACEICDFYLNFNDGYYPIEESPNIPEDTHPNCRCLMECVFNLPKHVSADVVFPGKLGVREEVI